MSLIKNIETYLDKYVAFPDPNYALPLALWTIGTHVYLNFDAFPYLVVTSHTKRSGKTRLSEIVSFLSANPRNFAAMTGPTLFRSIESEHPTIIFDEAETLSSEAASVQRSVLNVGYRKGQTIPRTVGLSVKEYDTYCPKVFVLIGDVYSTLKDRSIIVTMQRGEPRERFLYTVAKQEGEDIRAEIAASVLDTETMVEKYHSHKGLEFLTDRDEEIWMPLFILAGILCPGRIDELSRAAVDMSTEKTAEPKRYIQLQRQESKATDDEYARKLLIDLYSVFLDGSKVISSKNAVDALQGISIAPWRKFRGKGLTMNDLKNMVSRFGIKPVVVRVNKDEKVVRGYKLKDVEKAVQLLRP